MNFTITRITPAQWAELREIRLRSLLDSPDAFGQRYDDAVGTSDREWQDIARSSSRGDRRTWYIARSDDGRSIGVVQARRRSPYDCLLYSMWVAPEARRTGVGRALVDTVGEWGATWGARRIVLWVIAGNERAMRFYMRIGFSTLSEGPDADSGRAYGAFAMERPQASPDTTLRTM